MKIIKIGATWCMACIIVKNNLNKVLSKYPNILLEEYDIDIDQEQTLKYNISDNIPCLIFIKDDQEYKRLNGEVTKEKIEEVIGGLL